MPPGLGDVSSYRGPVVSWFWMCHLGRGPYVGTGRVRSVGSYRQRSRRATQPVRFAPVRVAFFDFHDGLPSVGDHLCLSDEVSIFPLDILGGLGCSPQAAPRFPRREAHKEKKSRSWLTLKSIKYQRRCVFTRNGRCNAKKCALL